ncbi:GNAT family N-acetyltransferase [Rheinheimera texasensis]|uniref:GNAT family N-acetyltransferase n=1 Tax=Rheinheimera texasensis TaxID=306205 RepID=UPI00068C953E|nr:GNAT family N-acetyltransferase [Rheinheimera texasensis]
MTPVEPIAAYGVVLTPVTTDDLALLRQWRNRPDISAQMLDQRQITEADQQRWYERVQPDASQQHFVIRYKNDAVGACNLKQPEGQPVSGSAVLESGFYLADPRFRGSMLAFFPALALNQFCFKTLGCTTLLAHVKLDNSAALRFNQQLGYQSTVQREFSTAAGPVVLQQMQLDLAGFTAATSRFARFTR